MYDKKVSKSCWFENKFNLSSIGKKYLKGIVGASSNVLGRNKPFLKLKYSL
jgi:hypothetical protein